MLRIPTPLSDELETSIHRVIGCCIAVHRELGPGLLENIYKRAVCIELELAGILFETEKAIPLMNFNVPVLKKGLKRMVL